MIFRCGVHDVESSAGKVSRRRRKRYALQGSRWQKRTISWRVDRYPVRAKVTQQQVEETVTEAFRPVLPDSGLVSGGK
jgi:hypothetical protein